MSSRPVRVPARPFHAALLLAVAAATACSSGGPQSQELRIRVLDAREVGSITVTIEHDGGLDVLGVEEPAGQCQWGTQTGRASSACVFDPVTPARLAAWRWSVRADGDAASHVLELRCDTFTPPEPGSVGREVWPLDCELE